MLYVELLILANSRFGGKSAFELLAAVLEKLSLLITFFFPLLWAKVYYSIVRIGTGSSELWLFTSWICNSSASQFLFVGLFSNLYFSVCF